MALPLLSVVHVNVNCSRLDRSLAFYRDRLALAPLVHTNPVPQDGEGFGLAGRVQWDAHLLYDGRGQAAPGIDLLEWKQPTPVGRPYAEPNHLGFFRLCFACPDVDALHARLRAEGVPCLSAPVEAQVSDEHRVRFFCARDPDGSTVEFIELPGEPRLLHVNVNCSDLARSSEWYQQVLGLERIGESRPEPCDGAGFGWSSKCQWRADFLALPGRPDHFVVDLLEWIDPKPVGTPYPSANHLGMFRMAFLVEDARACREQLVAAGVECPPAVWLDMGPDVPVDGLWAVFFPDPDGTCLELIEAPSGG